MLAVQLLQFLGFGRINFYRMDLLPVDGNFGIELNRPAGRFPSYGHDAAEPAGYGPRWGGRLRVQADAQQHQGQPCTYPCDTHLGSPRYEIRYDSTRGRI